MQCCLLACNTLSGATAALIVRVEHGEESEHVYCEIRFLHYIHGDNARDDHEDDDDGHDDVDHHDDDHHADDDQHGKHRRSLC